MKNLMKQLFLLLVLSFAVNVASARSLVPVVDREVPVSVASAKEPTLDAVRKVIITGAAAKGWIASDKGPGKLRLDIDVRGKHKAAVDVVYTTKSYTIKYADSENLKYDGNLIHPQYNNWVNYLVQSINAQMSML